MGVMRLSLVGMLILASLGGLGGASRAQEEPAMEEVGRVDSRPVTATTVTGSVVSSSTDPSELELTQDDGVMHGGGLKVTSEFAWSDPRLPSQGGVTMNLTGYDGVGFAYHYMWMLEDHEGYWTGPETGFCDAHDRCRGTAILTGHGTYDGLIAVLVTGPQLDSSGDVLRDSAGNITPVFDGAILFGDAPPMPDLPEPSAG